MEEKNRFSIGYSKSFKEGGLACTGTFYSRSATASLNAIGLSVKQE